MSSDNSAPNPPKRESRRELLAVFQLLEAIRIRALTPQGCASWLWETSALEVETVREQGVGEVRVQGPSSRGRLARFADVVAVAREEVLRVMRQRIRPPYDERFVSRAVQKGRVRQVASVAGAAAWRAFPDSADPLSEVLLALIAADALEHRASFEGDLEICSQCDGVGLRGLACPCGG